MKLTTRISSSAALLVAGTLMLSACSNGSADEVDVPEAYSEAPVEGVDHSSIEDAEASVQYPLSVQNCDSEVVFEEAPEHVMMLLTSPVTMLDGIGVFDRVFMKAGEYPSGYYGDALAAKVEAVPQLTEDVDTGHLLISPEEIVSHEPDLLLGLPDGVSREGMEDAGLNVIVDEIYCPGFSGEANFDLIYDEIERYGQIFDRVNEAGELIAGLKTRVDEVTNKMSDHDERTAVALYPIIDDGSFRAYGNSSMVQPQFDALGLRNLFEDNSERVFEVQPEVLIDLDPEVILVLYQGKKEEVENAVTSLPGGDQISAVVDDQVIYQLFNFTEPATPLTVTGLEKLADELG